MKELYFGSNKKGCKSHNCLIYILSAEREGFEPPEPLSSTVFKTAAIDHSAISPVVSNMYCNRFVLNCGAKVRIIFDCANFLKENLSLEENFSSFINR